MYEISSFQKFLDRFAEDKHEKMSQVYLQSFEKQKAAMQQAKEEQDADILFRACHDVKSLSLMIEANKLAALAKTTEHDASEGRAESALKNTDELMLLLEQAIVVIRGKLEAMGSA